MKLSEFKEKKEEFLTYLQIERNLSEHTLRAYNNDLQQFITFWKQLSPDDKLHLSFRRTIERYLVSLFYQKIDKSSIARKFSCFKSFEKFLKSFGIKLNLQLKRPRLDKKIPIYLSVDEIFHLLDEINNEQLPTRYPIRHVLVQMAQRQTNAAPQPWPLVRVNVVPSLVRRGGP